MQPAQVPRNQRHLQLILAAQNQARERGWYSMSNRADGESEVFIYGVIGGSFFDEGVDARQFVQEFRDLHANKIIVRINSPGGNIDDAVAIHNAIADRAEITETHVDGHALSAASWVGLSAGKVIMRPHSRMMIHEPHGIVIGNPADLRKYADVFDGMGNDIADALAAKGGGTREEWRERMREETWYGDQEAVDAGLADEVDGAPSAENTFDLSILTIFKNAPPARPRDTRDPQRQPDNNTPAPAAAAAAATERPPELIKAVLGYQRDESRRRGVTV